ncbi:MAG TPA: type II secretion system protein [bacterium]|nr:type II secretion system protein [bacterium]HXK95159.1 type II secretion system protein [bacterium]
MRRTADRRAFTLIELLLALTIMAVVMGSVFSTVTAGMRTYQQGQRTMALYQSARIALSKVTEELMLSLSPLSFWQPRDTYRQMTVDEVIATFRGIPVQEEDPGAIRFLGEMDRVLYVRKTYRLDQYPPFDLEECQIFVDSGTNQLKIAVLRSLLAVKQATWFYQYLFKVNLNGIVVPDMGGRARFRQMGELGEPPLADFIGDYGVLNRQYILAEGIKGIKFRYGDDSGWKTSWDSQELVTSHRISPNSPNFNIQQDTQLREAGPPLVVEIQLLLENGDTLATSTDIPAGNMRAAIGKGAQVETAPPPQTPAPTTPVQPETGPAIPQPGQGF